MAGRGERLREDGLATAGDVIGALERRYNPPSKPREWATFTEMSDGAQRRRVDFLAVNMWISRGRRVHGAEIKVRREDWLKELRQPKADSWYGVSDEWYIVAPQGVVHEHEVPQGWGYVEIQAGPKGVWRCKTKIEAERLTPIDSTPWWLIQRLLGRVDEREQQAMPDERALAEKWQEGHKAGSESAEAYMVLREQTVKRAEQEQQELRKTLGRFTAEEVARACAVLGAGGLRYRGQQISRELRTAAEQIDAMLRNASAPVGDEIEF